MSLRKLLVVVTALSGSILGATTAHASESIGWTYVETQLKIGGAHFVANGDVVEVCDFFDDRFGIVGYLLDSNDHIISPKVHAVGRNRCVARVKDLPEGKALRLKVCATYGGHEYQCKRSRLGAA
ncbi:hypothetical protein [Streptomyces avermitilis]|uniref:hypothetical protein n=1 Tax=Streptomyces avermitilis TaxID=33903 RepID=UPI003697CA61